MRVFRNRELNNKGVSLVTVIVCMLFAAIIAAGVLTISVSNVEFTNQQKRNAQSNYTAEQVMDETKASIKTIADEAYSKAFENTMKTYGLVCDGATTIEMVFKKEFNTEFIKLLLDNYVISKPNGSEYTSLSTNQEVAEKVMEELASATVLTKLSNPSMLVEESELNEGKLVKSKKHPNVCLTLRPETDGTNTLILKNLAFEYEDKYSNTSEAMTDLIMNVSFPTIKTQGAGAGQVASIINSDWMDYSIIADGGIDFEAEDYHGDIDVRGNLYSGTDINVCNVFDFDPWGHRINGFDFQGDLLITRGNLNVGDETTFVAKGKNGGNTEIWTNQINVKNKYSSSSYHTECDIKGTVYIADKLTLDAGNNSSFTMLGPDSSMYFYKAGDESNPGYAINIGERQVLDLSGSTGGDAKGLDNLWIYKRGFAYVSGTKVKMVQTKNNYSFGSNKKSEFHIDLENIKSRGELIVTNDNTVNSTALAEEALIAQTTQWANDYSGLTNGLTKGYANTNSSVCYGIANPSINGNEIQQVIREVSGNPSYVMRGSISDTSSVYSDYPEYITGITGFGGTRYDSTYHPYGYYSSGSVTFFRDEDNSDREGFIYANGSVEVSIYDNRLGISYGTFSGVIVAGGAVSLNCNFNGLIIAGGNVTVYENVDVNATIISGGKVIFKGDNKINSLTQASGNIKNRIENEIANNPILKKVLEGAAAGTPTITPSPIPAEPSSAPTSAPLQNSYDSISIEYDNWRKY